MLVLECAWHRGDTGFAVLDDAVGVRGRAAHADGQYYGVWRRAGNTLLVCGRESEWASTTTSSASSTPIPAWPLALIPGPDEAPWGDAIRWARRWAHTATPTGRRNGSPSTHGRAPTGDQ